MKPFVFALTPVLKLRIAQEKQQAAALNGLKQRILKLMEDSDRLTEALSGLAKEMESLLNDGIQPWKMEGCARFARCLFDRKDQNRREHNRLLAEEETLKLELLKLRQEIKLLQNLKDKRYASYLAELDTAWQKEMDERIAFLESVELKEA